MDSYSSSASSSSGSRSNMSMPSSSLMGPTPPPTDESVNILLGTCHLINTFFVIQGAVAVLVYVLAMVSAYMQRKGPPPTHQRGGEEGAEGEQRVPTGKPDYGSPWTLLTLFWSVSFWGIAPIVTFFVLYHQAIPNLFPMGSNMACINQATFPAIPLLFGLGGFILWITYRPQGPCDALCAWIANELAKRAKAKSLSHTQTMAMMSSSVRGMIYVKTADYLLQSWASFTASTSMRLPPPPAISLVDMAKQEDYCNRSASLIDAAVGGSTLQDAMHFVEQGVERPEGGGVHSNSVQQRGGGEGKLLDDAAKVHVASADYGGVGVNSTPYHLPFADESLDMVVFPLFYRKMPQFGGMSGTAAKVQARSRGMMVEVYRCLRPGGKVLICDAMQATIFTLQDCEEVGLKLCKAPYDGQEGEAAQQGGGDQETTENVEEAIIKPDLKWSPWCCVRVQLYAGYAIKPSKAELEGGESLLNEKHAALQQALLAESDSAGDAPGAKELTQRTKLIIVCGYQFLIWVALFFLAGAMYQPLDVPKNIVLGQRLGNVMSQLCTNYPMMAFFVRDLFLSEGHSYSVGELLLSTLKSDCIAILMSFTLSVVFFFPSFFMQLILNSTSLTSGTKAGIGLAIALVLGLNFTYWHMGNTKKKEYRLNNVDLDMVKRISKM